MLIDLILTIVGLALLVAGGDAMVRGASALAARFHISPVAIGLTVVAFGTSAPELAVNVVAASQGHTALSFGNILGSNMANIGLIVALVALVQPLQIHNVIIRREVPMMLLASLVAAALGLDGLFVAGEANTFDRGDGVVLLLLFSVFIYYTLGDLLTRRSDGSQIDIDGLKASSSSLQVAIVQTVLGTTALVAGGAVTVEGATGVAEAMGISQTIIGLTLLAIGTSLPELSASVIATMRGHSDMAIGNIVGSNIFNLLIVLGTTSTIAPVAVPEGGFGDILIVLLLSLLFLMTSISRGRIIIRAEASVLLATYLGYLAVRTLH